MVSDRSRAGLGAFLALGLSLAVWALPAAEAPLLEGVFWQPTDDYAFPSGNWHLLGADTLIVQWTVNDGRAWMPSRLFPTVPRPPDWGALQREPWAGRVVLGLASRMDLEAGRADWQRLLRHSRQAVVEAPLQPVAWYAPLEISPDWEDAAAVAAYLEDLPRPLQVSAYGGYDMSPAVFADWVASWLPEDVVLLYQDGVGVGRHSPEQARARVDVLRERFGEDRVVMVLEAFSESSDGRFGPASLRQLMAQFRAYRGLRVYAFSARHFSAWRVRALQAAAWLGLL